MYDAYLSDPTLEGDEQVKLRHQGQSNSKNVRKLTIKVHENYKNEDKSDSTPIDFGVSKNLENARSQQCSRLKESAIHAVVSPGIKPNKRVKGGVKQMKHPKIQIQVGPQKAFPGSPVQNADELIRSSKKNANLQQNSDSQRKTLTGTKQKRTRLTKLIPHQKPHLTATENQMTPSSNGG